VRSSPTNLPRGRELALGSALGDILVDLYVDWREECINVQASYDRWRDATRHDQAAAFAAYRAALDREERAAGAYAELIRRVARAGQAPA
jgi:hypothetical protein